jgi:hypothetical protein
VYLWWIRKPSKNGLYGFTTEPVNVFFRLYGFTTEPDRFHHRTRSVSLQNPCSRACTHKIAIGDSDLINVRFGPLCGLKRDISQGRLGVRSGRQAHREHRALACLARHSHVAAHHARELAREGKAEPRSTVAARGERIGLGELLE